MAPDQDDTPLGPALTGIVLLGPQTPVAPAPVAGLDASAVPRLDNPAAQALLKPYLGRKLSNKLIAEIKAVITAYYRRKGYPFLTVQTPPQEITSGVVQFRLVEFVLGQVVVTGGERASPDRVRHGVRAVSGQPINSDRLGQDLDWLNRNLFRRINAVFTPGAALGVSDLQLQVSESRSWRVYGGYANSGAPSTGSARYFVGASTLLGQDSVLSYQFTGGDQAFDSTPNYASHAATLFAPFKPRQAIELTLSTVESNVAVQAFEVNSRTSELRLGYVGVLSNFTALAGEVSAGVEAKRQRRKILFGGVSVLDQALDVYQAYLGWSDVVVGPSGRADIDLSLHASPGGLNNRNDSDSVQAFTSGRVATARYAHLRGAYARVTRLGHGGVSLTSRLSGQYTGSALPDSEQIGLGGASLVRGYSLDDGAFDRGLVVSTELRNVAANRALGRLTVEPFVFVDAGWGAQMASGDKSSLLSSGLGLDVLIAKRFAVAATAGYAWTDAAATRAGAWRADVRLTAVF